MQLPLQRLSLRQVSLQPLLVGTAWLLVLAISAWIVAGWYWHLSAAPVQSARPAPVSDPVAAAQDISSRQLFGTLTNSQGLAATSAPPPSMVLIGVSTRWGKLPGYAIIRDGSANANSFIEGEDIASGIKLVRVLADSIEIDRNGVRETISLNVTTTPSADTPQARTTQPNTQPNLQPNTQANTPPAPPPPAADN
ncbi:type II secretion system protein N [Uliginosibacterium sp. H3]|uniref:Type II secretion system protein N n=1 Tax=Uliginosibacterium silvisoli TaxID=3114758 RepID=A0ABU6K942_9RHOO|nr:type II secretion system protein N [Uliginosibacterium sp. H3]